MPTTASLVFSGGKICDPISRLDLAASMAVALAPGIYAAGTVLGQISTANVADVQTVTSSLTGGSFRLLLTLQGVSGYTGNIAYSGTGATFAANIQTALNTLIQATYPSGSVAVTGTGPFVVTFGGTLANQPVTVMSVDNTLATGGTASVAHTTTGAGPSGTYRAYAAGSSDGSQVPTGFLKYPAFVDNGGNIYMGNVSGPVSEFGQSDLSLPMWYRGDFDLADLVGLDSGALTALGAHFITGSLASGKGIVSLQ